MSPSRYVHMFQKQRDLMGFDEVRDLIVYLEGIQRAIVYSLFTLILDWY